MKHIAEQFEFSFTPSALNKMRDEVFRLSQSKGWYDDKSETDAQYVMRAVANLHGEVSELWEAYRNGGLNKPCDKADKMTSYGIPGLTCQEEEIADIIIRALDYCARMGIDADSAVLRKHQFNSTRSHKHGGKLA